MYIYVYIYCADHTSRSWYLGPTRAVTSSTRRYRKSHVNAIRVNSVGVYYNWLQRRRPERLQIESTSALKCVLTWVAVIAFLCP